MDRRHFLARSGLLAAAVAANPSRAFAAEILPAANPLLDSSTDCVKRGQLCLEHCVESLSSGSKAMAGCAGTVREMLVYCEALTKAAAQKSKHLKALAKIARDACLECETECRKHEKMDVCKVCADACAACAKACSEA